MTPERIIEIRPDYIFYAVKGTYIGLPQAFGVFKEISELAKKHNTSRILFDISEVENMPAILERYDLGEVAAKTWGFQLKIAVVANPKEITGFFETVAVNRGAFMKVLTNIEEAEIWLGND